MIDIPPLYPILDTGVLALRGIAAADAASALLEAGVRILQFRHKGPFTRAIFESAERVAGLCRDAGAVCVVNDRADVALMIGVGVHVGQDDLPPRAVRAVLGSGAVIGLSTHNEVQIREGAGEPVDYVAIGPVFTTGSKDNPDPVVGLEELRRLRAQERRPIVAIGGITAENAPLVLEAGADSVAVIGALYPIDCTVAEVRRAARLLLARVNAR